MRYVLPCLLTTLGLSLAAIGPSSADGGACLANRDVQNAVAAELILPLDQILAVAGVELWQEVLSVKVCDRRGQLYYKVAVIDASGEAQNLTMDALTGEERRRCKDRPSRCEEQQPVADDISADSDR